MCFKKRKENFFPFQFPLLLPIYSDQAKFKEIEVSNRSGSWSHCGNTEVRSRFFISLAHLNKCGYAYLSQCGGVVDWRQNPKRRYGGVINHTTLMISSTETWFKLCSEGETKHEHLVCLRFQSVDEDPDKCHSTSPFYQASVGWGRPKVVLSSQACLVTDVIRGGIRSGN